jgi:hypothetical protein
MLSLMGQDRARTLHVGTETDGFRVTHTPGGSELRVEGWGYWDNETCLAFGRHAGSALEKLTAPIVLVLDATVLKPQGTEGQDALRAFFKRAAGAPGSSARALAANVLTRMQLTRLARDAGLELDFDGKTTSTPPIKGR